MTRFILLAFTLGFAFGQGQQPIDLGREFRVSDGSIAHVWFSDPAALRLPVKLPTSLWVIIEHPASKRYMVFLNGDYSNPLLVDKSYGTSGTLYGMQVPRELVPVTKVELFASQEVSQ